jgi:hypothetical protein
MAPNSLHGLWKVLTNSETLQRQCLFRAPDVPPSWGLISKLVDVVYCGTFEWKFEHCCCLREIQGNSFGRGILFVGWPLQRFPNRIRYAVSR